jgi:hypothetical protein
MMSFQVDRAKLPFSSHLSSAGELGNAPNLQRQDQTRGRNQAADFYDSLIKLHDRNRNNYKCTVDPNTFSVNL